MRFLLSCVLLALVPTLRAAEELRAATPEEAALFKAALKNTEQDTDRWAYTETTRQKIGLGKTPKGETIVRFDPSKPYSEQYTPIQIEGREPTEKERKKYREKGERRGENITKAAARAADPTIPDKPVVEGAKRRKDTQVKPDVEHPRVVGVDQDLITFDVPLTTNSPDFPVDKFEVRAVVNQKTRHVEHASFRIKEAFRMKLVAKVKAGEGSIDFAVIDPKYPPVMTAASGTVGASLLLVPLNATFASTRTDYQRVKPYNERLQVKLGPLELLDF
jgi:hypothetical protein